MRESDSAAKTSKAKRGSGRKGRPRNSDGSTAAKALQIAEELIGLRGIEGFQLQEVADRLDVKPPALYNHFASREDLVAQVARKVSRDAIEMMVRKPNEDSLTAFRSFARKLVTYYAENPAAARMILWEIAKGGVEGWEESAALDSWARNRSAKAFERSVQAGEFRDIRFGFYMAVMIGGMAALALWPSYDKAAKRESVRKLQAEADDFVVRLISPDLVLRN